MHDSQTEKYMIEECVRAGALDPFSGMHRPYVDGEPLQTNMHIIDLLHGIIRHATVGSIFTRSYQDTWKNKIKNR